MTENATIKLEKSEGVASITFARPKHNVFNIDMMQEFCGVLEEVSQDAIPHQIRDLVPVAHRVQALVGQIVGVVAALAHALRPADERRVQTLLHLLCLLI